MTLTPGAKLGPYEILSPLGAGGMGEVYRAKDTRLGREVAIKVLPESMANDPEALARFEREAKAVAALSHPNILALHDIGNENGVAYAVMELLEGETLRARLNAGMIPPRKLTDFARQIAEGLAAAHDKGIIHRDLKPENLWVTADGRMKILDFGLAKVQATAAEFSSENTPTRSVGTGAGVTLGTVGYMSPEQVRGEPADHRADIFSFGAVLYEMASGRRAFKGDSAVETMNAILKEEPPEISLSAAASSGLDRIIRHCLEKKAAERFQSARDMAFDLASLSGATGSGAPISAGAGRMKQRRLIMAAGFALTLLAGAFWLGGKISSRRSSAALPVYHRLTYGRGTIWSARFSPDGHTIVYAASWEGQPTQLFMKRVESPGSIALALPAANILAISAQGELAIQVAPRVASVGLTRGTLAQSPLNGGTPREILEEVQEADWDGANLVVARSIPGHSAIEWPIGKTVYATNGHVSHPRLAPQGDLLAFFDHPEISDDRGALALLDRAGKKRILSDGWESLQGLAWSPDGAEVWFSAAHAGTNWALYAVNRAGRLRLVANPPGGIILHDIARNGRMLISEEETRQGILAMAPGETTERDLSWLEGSGVSDLSADGKTLLFFEWGEEMGPNYGVCLRKTDGSPPVRLGEGAAMALSPDGHWVLSALPGERDHINLLPTGAGSARIVKFDGISSYNNARWLPDNQHFVFAAAQTGRPPRCFLGTVDGGKARPVTPEGSGCGAVTPDGRGVTSKVGVAASQLFPVEGGEPHPLAGLTPDDWPIRWAADGKTLWVRTGQLPAVIDRVDTVSGTRQTVRKLFPADAAGVVTIANAVITPDGAAYAYTVRRELSRLYLAEGLK